MMQDDPWAKYLVSEDTERAEETPRPEPGIAPKEKNTDFSKYAVENIPEYAQRQVGRTASRALETLGGTPGNLLRFLDEAALFIPEKVSGTRFEDLRKNLEQTASHKLLPTSEQLKTFSQEKTGGKTAPQTENESRLDNITELTTGLLSFAPNPLKASSWLKSLGIASAAVGAKETGKAFGVGEKGQTGLEIGTALLLSMLDPKGVKNFISNSYNASRAKIPPKTMLPTDALDSELAKIEQKFQKGLKTPSKAPALQEIKKLRKKTKLGQIEAQELVDIHHDLNEIMHDKKLYEGAGDTVQQKLRRNLEDVRKPVSKAIESYGEQNPEFYQGWKSSNEAYGASAQSGKIVSSIKKIVKKIPEHLIPTAAYNLVIGEPQIAATLLGAAGGLMGARHIAQILKSPNLQKYYGQLVKNAAKENAAGTIQSLRKLDEELKKEFKNLPQTDQEDQSYEERRASR